MGKSRAHKTQFRVEKQKDKDEKEREERLLAQLAAYGRAPTPQGGHFHDTGEKQRRRKDRKAERTRLKDMTKEFNNG
jgi:hypothetical protein